MKHNIRHLADRHITEIHFEYESISQSIDDFHGHSRNIFL